MDSSEDRHQAEGRARPWPLIGTIAVLAVVTVLNNVVAEDLYLLWACLALVGLALLAGHDGLCRADVGLGPVTGRAARAAGALAVVAALAMLIGTGIPGIASAYVDERVAGMGAGELALSALVRAPVGTALLEEVAFRGVLLAMLTRRYGVRWGVVGSSVAFGAWHLLPALGLATGNEAVGAVLGANEVLVTALGVVASGLAGALLCLLRLRYDHLIVPLALHVTTNSLGYVLAWFVVNP